MVIKFLVIAICFAASAVLTRYLIGHAKQRQFLDIPNERSSHSTPTPTGGGVSIVVIFISFILVAELIFNVTVDEVFVLAFTGSVMAVVGYIDDHLQISAQWRLLVHFLVSLVLLLSLKQLPELSVFGYQWQSGWLLSGLYLIALVWLLNLFNFMDGIDGIAGVQAVTALLGAALILWSAGSSYWPIILMALSASILGFLVFNWPPAKIFMGDAGSNFLGFMLGALALITASTGLINLWAWLILLAIFIGDSTLTLLRRVKQGDKLYEAHRSHAYQILSRRWNSHVPVTLLVLCVNLIWLLPLAWAASVWPAEGILLCLLAYAPLLWFMYQVGAGTTNH
jgi:Fuc2NAc and GlcNAc transferase